jgi:hypothetical protein
LANTKSQSALVSASREQENDKRMKLEAEVCKYSAHTNIMQVENLRQVQSQMCTANEEIDTLRRELANQSTTIKEYESTLEEMGVHLSQYVLNNKHHTINMNV